jgi:hypothetical protein
LKVFDLANPGQAILVHGPTRSYQILPENSVVLLNVPIMLPGSQWEHTYQQLKILQDQKITAPFVFVDGAYDPVRFGNRELLECLDRIKSYFPGSKIAFLSSRVQHWYDNVPGIIYVPFFLYVNYFPHEYTARHRRIGCLNRNNTPHRIWLMHNLLKQNLLDSERDVYSVRFDNIYDNSVPSITTWLGQVNSPYDIDHDISQWPTAIATHPDDFPNDFTTNHPAWNTAIAIITETEAGWRTMLTEKTWKAIRSRSCWTAYMDQIGYQFLRDVGFEPDLFEQHASFIDIQPIVNICKKFDTQAVALDYYHSQLAKINHNFDWSGGNNQTAVENFTSPWAQRFLPKFQQALECL